MTGKQKCKILKEIRRQIAQANDIRYVVEECTHKGKCKGTCPRCEWEVRELEKALEKRRLAGKKVALAGISAGMIVSSTTACSPVETIGNAINRLLGNELEGEMVLEGDVPYTPDTMQPLSEETETVEPLMGDPVPESAIDIPGEVVEIKGVIAPPETDDLSETDEEFALAGVPLYEEETTPVWEEPWDDDELFLEGDVAFPDTEEETK